VPVFQKWVRLKRRESGFHGKTVFHALILCKITPMATIGIPLTQIRTEKLQMNVIYKEFHVTGGALRRA
jgi:hypothetical protein